MPKMARYSWSLQCQCTDGRVKKFTQPTTQRIAPAKGRLCVLDVDAPQEWVSVMRMYCGYEPMIPQMEAGFKTQFGVSGPRKTLIMMS
jgi:hypothetical protein